MYAKVWLLFFSKNFEDFPTGGAAVDAVVGEGLGQNDVDDLFPKKEFSAFGILDDVGDGAGGCCPRFCVGAFQVFQHGQNLDLAELRELWVRRRFHGLCDGVDTVFPHSVLARFTHVGKWGR